MKDKKNGIDFIDLRSEIMLFFIHLLVYLLSNRRKFTNSNEFHFQLIKKLKRKTKTNELITSFYVLGKMETKTKHSSN